MEFSDMISNAGRPLHRAVILPNGRIAVRVGVAGGERQWVTTEVDPGDPPETCTMYALRDDEISDDAVDLVASTETDKLFYQLNDFEIGLCNILGLEWTLVGPNEILDAVRALAEKK